LAEVSLTFDTAGLPGDTTPGHPWARLASRSRRDQRLYRAAKVNTAGGVPCRLRDIVEFFLGTGLLQGLTPS